MRKYVDIEFSNPLFIKYIYTQRNIKGQHFIANCWWREQLYVRFGLDPTGCRFGVLACFADLLCSTLHRGARLSKEGSQRRVGLF